MTQTNAAVRGTPLPYTPSYEIAEEGEAQTQTELNETLTRIQETTYGDEGHALRAVHAKSHALLRGTFHVLPDLPPVLAQGLFQQPASYSMVMRLSTNPGDILDDSVSTPRGMALKLVGVRGPRLVGTEDDSTQDFVLVNGPAFLNQDGKGFVKGLKLLAATTDRAPGLKKVVSAVLRGAESLVEHAGGQSPALVNLGGQPQTHLLGETYYSATPYLHGVYMGKSSVAPISPDLTALTGKKLSLKGKPNGLREAAVEFFSEHGGVWEFRVQLCTSLESMPIENAKVVWPEDASPYIAVARIELPAQRAWSEDRSRVIDDGYSFNPWHGLAAHRPLGSVNRLRKQAYEKASRFRTRRTGMPADEPRSFDSLPD